MRAKAASSPGQSIEEVAREQNHYVSHLADVNKETDVVSTEDIYNSNGVLVVPKGVRVKIRVLRRKFFVISLKTLLRNRSSWGIP